MSHTNTEGKNPEYVARGLKATIHNDRVSDEAKESAAQRLEEMGVDVPADYAGGESGDTTTAAKESSLSSNQERGYKATLKNPRVSDEAKEHAEEVLAENGVSY